MARKRNQASRTISARLSDCLQLPNLLVGLVAGILFIATVVWGVVSQRSAEPVDATVGGTEHQTPDAPSGIVVADTRQQLPVVVSRLTAEELRRRNSVRALDRLEEGQEISSLAGVYGFSFSMILGRALAWSRIFDREFDVSLSTRSSSERVELHKTSEGQTLVLVFVDDSSATRLQGATGGVGTVFGFFEPQDEHYNLVALPISRIVEWDHRVGGGFAEIQID